MQPERIGDQSINKGVPKCAGKTGDGHLAIQIDGDSNLIVCDEATGKPVKTTSHVAKGSLFCKLIDVVGYVEFQNI